MALETASKQRQRSRLFYRQITLLITAVLLTAGCTYDPLLYSEEVPGEIDKPSMALAAVDALQSRGYTIALINENTGTVTTRWSDVTGAWGYLFEVTTRKRLMVSIALDGQSVSVQMTKQERSETMGWTNSAIRNKDKREIEAILDEILSSPIYL